MSRQIQRFGRIQAFCLPSSGGARLLAQAFSASKLRPISIAFARFIPTFLLAQFADKTSRLTNDFGRSRDENPGGSALVGFAGTRHTPFAAIARVDRNAHRALGRKAAVIPDHILFCNYCTRGASNLVPIS